MVKIMDKIEISKEKILEEYTNIDDFIKEAIEIVYCEKEIDITKHEIIKTIEKYEFGLKIIQEMIEKRKYDALDDLKGKTGVYIFLKDGIPQYIGIGGEKHDGKDENRLYTRLTQELRKYDPSSSDTGATLSKNIQEIETALGNITYGVESIEIIKTFDLIVLLVGDITKKEDVEKARVLETVLIALFHPKYNK